MHMQVFDCAIAWEWEPDRQYIHLLNDACQAKGVSTYLMGPANITETIARLERGELIFRVFYDRASDTDARFLPLIHYTRQMKSFSVNEYSDTLRALDKATMHLEFLTKGILVPYTVILSPYYADPGLKITELERLGRPFIIKPATGGGGTGVVLGAETLHDIIEARKQFGSDKYLLQEKVQASVVDSRRTWFRVIYCCGSVFPFWWDDRIHIYENVTEVERFNYNLDALWKIPKDIAEVCHLDIFSTEICLTPKQQFITVDYVNDPCDMRPKSIHVDGVPDPSLARIVDVLSNYILKNRDRSGFVFEQQISSGPGSPTGIVAD